MIKPTQESVSLNDQPHHSDPQQISSVIEPVPGTSLPCQPNGVSLVDHASSEKSGSSRSSQPGPSMGRSLGQILVILVVLLVLVNIPFNSYRAGLAQLMPQSNPIVIRDGLLLKGSGPEIYMVDNHRLRQISPEALRVFFSRSRQINPVEDSLLEQFGHGPPVQRLLQCRTKPEIYAVEDGHKRWVKAPPIGAVRSWDKANFVRCSYLEGLPDGPPIP